MINGSANRTLPPHPAVFESPVPLRDVRVRLNLPLKVRTAKRGKNQGNPFWGVRAIRSVTGSGRWGNDRPPAGWVIKLEFDRLTAPAAPEKKQEVTK